MSINARQMTLKAKKKSIKTVNFGADMPNYFYFNNLSENYLYFGATVMPNEQKYEKKIKPYQDIMIGRPSGIAEIMIYNAGDTDATFLCTYYEGAFDPNVMNTVQIDDVEISNLGSIKLYDGVITGWKSGVMLPAGNNMIGKVETTASTRDHTLLSTINDNVNEMYERTGTMENTLGSMDSMLASISSDMSQGLNLIDTSINTGNSTIATTMDAGLTNITSKLTDIHNAILAGGGGGGGAVTLFAESPIFLTGTMGTAGKDTFRMISKQLKATMNGIPKIFDGIDVTRVTIINDSYNVAPQAGDCSLVIGQGELDKTVNTSMILKENEIVDLPVDLVNTGMLFISTEVDSKARYRVIVYCKTNK